MKRLISIFALLLTVVSFSYAQVDTLKYRISLSDKLASEYSIHKPEQFLSVKAIERRKKQNLPIDETDLPISSYYLRSIQELGAKVLVTGKWDNFVTVVCNSQESIDKIKMLPFVKNVKLVWSASNNSNDSNMPDRDSLVNRMQHYDTYYGASEDQIKLNHIDKLHTEGYKGEGMTIAVIDAGYHNMDRIKGLKNVSVLGVKDFVNPESDIYAENSHGLAVLSCMAMNKPHYMVGSAPKASYWLLRSEDDSSEHKIEQDYWSAAVEFADSVGVDVINTSLGYNTFDDSSQNYEYRDLDGKHSLMSRQASRVADKGMILVCSAGNAGSSSWKKVTAPGDADNVITVGAVDSEGLLAPFSSIGNTADGRVKPDVVAVGWKSAIMETDGVVGIADGTSFATPTLCGMVTCLWQALPQLSAKEIINLVRDSGDRSDFPDNIYGYGVPNFWNAYLKMKK